MTETTPLNPRTFDIFALAEGRSFPQDIVDIYLDHASAYQAAKIETQISNTLDPEIVNALDEKRKALLETVKDSRLTFHMKGLSQKIIHAVELQADAKFGSEDTKDGVLNQEKSQWRYFGWLAAQIADVYNAKDERDSRVWTSEDVRSLFELIPVEASTKLDKSLTELTFTKALLFEQVDVSPDFS